MYSAHTRKSARLGQHNWIMKNNAAGRVCSTLDGSCVLVWWKSRGLLSFHFEVVKKLKNAMLGPKKVYLVRIQQISWLLVSKKSMIPLGALEFTITNMTRPVNSHRLREKETQSANKELLSIKLCDFKSYQIGNDFSLGSFFSKEWNFSSVVQKDLSTIKAIKRSYPLYSKNRWLIFSSIKFFNCS